MPVYNIPRGYVFTAECPSCHANNSAGNVKLNENNIPCCGACDTCLMVVDRREVVNHPPHYGGADNPHEVYKCLEARGLTASAYLWNVIKYVARAGKKEDKLIQDLKKAQWYLQKEIERLERENAGN